MNYLLFFIYLFLLCWLLTKIKFIQHTGLGNRTIIILFLIKIAAGIANGWLNKYYYAVSDSISLHTEGIVQYHLLFSHPKEYLMNLFTSNSKNLYGGLFDINSYWNNLRSNIIVKLLSLFDIFSNCNYFINTLFYNFLVFFGSVSLYRAFIEIFANKKYILFITVFLLPSFLYFTSGIHRDGLVFLAIAFFSYNMFCIIYKEGITLRRMLYIFFSLALIFLLRNFVFVLILPAITAWIIAEKRPKFNLPVFVMIYSIFVILFFSLKFIHPILDLPQYVSARQIAFIEIGKLGNSTMNINPLLPDFGSFFYNIPEALNHSLMRPYFSENKIFLYIPASLEIFIYEVLLLMCILFPVKKFTHHGFIYYGLFFAFTMLLIIGYTIPILGAIIRYRSIYLPFIITPISCMIDLEKVKKYIFKDNI